MTNHNHPWREKDALQDNPIGLPEKACKEMVTELDRHQATLFVQFHQYQKHHWLVEGPQFRDLHLFLEEAYKHVHKEVDVLAERITALGGTPTCAPAAFTELAYIEHEPEGTFHLRAMLERDRECEGQIAQRLRQSIKRATDLGDYGTELLLKQTLVGVENRAHHLEMYLGEDSLEIGREGDPAGAESYAASHG